MEMYSPVKELDAEDRLYYEIGDTYRVVRAIPGQEYLQDPDSQGIYHETDEILLTEGDVYFRSTAVNFRKYDDTSYADLIIETTPDTNSTDGIDDFQAPESNFKSYYLESSSGSDLFKSDGISVGRPHVIKHDAKEAYKEASLIHSDRDITEAGKVSYSSFNRSVPIDMDLDLKNGAINYLANHDENCIFIQKDKCGHVPIDRNIISDVSGESNLIASSKFLNTPRYYAGRAGADGNPESVVSIDNAAYFAHKSLGEVYKISGANGVNVISGNNMDSYFGEVFQQAIDKSTLNGSDVRVVGGYDPMKDEFLITVLDPITYGLNSLPVFPDQPSVSVPILGCTDPFAINYNPLATVDNGLCNLPVYGCMDPLAGNYNPLADIDDNSCLTRGCMDPLADNYNPTANVDNDNCIYEGCMDETALNYDPLYNVPDNSCVYDLPNYTGDICDYYLLINASGFVTEDSITQAYNDVLALLQSTDPEYSITEYEAAVAFPDFNADNVIDLADMFDMISSQYALDLPIECGPIVNPDDEVSIPNASLSWQDGNPADSPQMFTAQFNGGSNVAYPGSGSYFGAYPTSFGCVGASQDTIDGVTYEYENVFASVCEANGGSWEPLTWDVTETTGTPPVLAPNGQAIGSVSVPRNLILNLSNLDSMVDGQSIVVTVELDNLNDNISYIGADSSFLSYQGNDLGTQFMLKLNPSPTVSEIVKYKKYKITIDGLAASYNAYGSSIGIPLFSLKDQAFDPPLWKNGTATFGVEEDSIYYQEPTTLSNEPQSSTEDVIRTNSLSYSIEYTNIDQTTDSSGTAPLVSNMGWVNSAPPPADSPAPNLPAKSRQTMGPLPFTGNMCDYPMLIQPDGGIDQNSIMAAAAEVEQIVSDYLAENPDGGDPNELNPGPNELYIRKVMTFNFPNFAGVGAWSGSGFGSLDFSQYGGNYYSDFDVQNCLHIISETGAINCSLPPMVQPFTGNLCDYPMLTQGNPLSENGFQQVGFQSIYNAWSEVDSMIASGELTPATATQHFPNWAGVADPDPVASLNFGIYGGAEYNTYDLTSAINYFTEVMDANGIAPWQVAFTLLECVGLEPEPETELTLPFTGNICDYPMLVSSVGTGFNVGGGSPEGQLEGLPGGLAEAVTSNNVTDTYEWLLVRMNLAETNSSHITDAEATFLFPDINGDGTIGVTDLLGVLSLLDTTWLGQSLEVCSEPFPWTGSICDYPWLLDANGNPDQFLINFFYQQARFDPIYGGNVWLLDSTYGTWIFPDFNGDGIISESDRIALVSGLFFMGEATLDCTETPPGMTKPPLRQRAALAKAVKALGESIPKEEMQKQIKKLNYASR